MNSDSKRSNARLGTLERLPKWLIVIPLLVQWLALGIRHRSLTLPSVANPMITAGGLVGEGKTEYFACMGALARSATATNDSFVVESSTTVENVLRRMERGELAFPIIAKPDIGWCGFGVRRIDTKTGLANYLEEFPVGERLVLQTYVADEGEAGIFYVRFPQASTGRLVGLALRRFPQITGDGLSTISELIKRDTRLRRLANNSLHHFECNPNQILNDGERLRLSTIGSTRIGGLYKDGHILMTPKLHAAIDAITRDMPEFHFGRLDVRYRSEESLMAGIGFTIIEVNGAGSEAIEAWDPDLNTLQAFGKIFRKQALLFKIAAANRQRGFIPVGLLEVARLHFKQQRLIQRYPTSN